MNIFEHDPAQREVRPAFDPTGGVTATITGNCARWPNQIAVEAGTERRSYAALGAGSRRMAARLSREGLAGGVLIAICLPRSPALVEAVLGCWQSGAAFLALDPAWPDNRLRAIIADAACAGLICDGAAGQRSLIAGDRPVLLITDDAPSAESPADVGDRAPSGGAADALAYVIYTSGSTGAPKGIELTQGGLASLCAWHIDAFALSATDRVAHVAGLGFDASIWEIWPALCAGATLVQAPDPVRVSAPAMRDWLVASRVTVAFVPTVLAEQLLALDWPEDTALRLLLTGGDRLHVFPPAGLPFALVNNYGPSECTVVATSGIVAPRAEAAGLPSIGTAITGTHVYLLDEAMQPVADGVPGEIYIGGAGVGRGYRGRPDLTAERFLEDPFQPAARARMYRSGDVGMRDAATGEIAFIDRVDDQVQVRGQRVEPAEIAAAIARHAAIASATVVAHGDELVAYLVLRGEDAPTGVEMRDFLGAELPAAMIPAQFVLLDALPMTANGKLDRSALPPPTAARQLAEAAFGAATTPTEARLTELLSVIIKGRVIGVDDNFFMIGGHSLLGAQLVIRASEAFGIDLSLRDLFEAPSVRQLAVRIETRIFELVAAMSDDDIALRAAE